MGFTPRNGSPHSRAQCQSTINRQINNGYVLEYITETAPIPNPGYENDPLYLEEIKHHSINKGRLVAVHRLMYSSQSLVDILGEAEFTHLQDMWAIGQAKWRWSVAFPIIESYEIVTKPRAADVFGTTEYRKLYAVLTTGLRKLNDTAIERINELEIIRIAAPNFSIAVDGERAAVEASSISDLSKKLIDEDLSGTAFEGEAEERKLYIRKRAAWKADQFINERQNAKTLHCDVCGFDPAKKLNPEKFRPRTALDVHHKFPLEEGTRYTCTKDFALLCPTCHRMEHQLLKKAGSFFDRARTPNFFPS